MDIVQKFRDFIAWMRTPTDFRMERYLSKSVDVADLDYRMRKWHYMTDAEKNQAGYR